MIKTAQRLGFTLAEVADLLEAGTHHHQNQHGGRRHSAGLQERAADKLAQVEQRIADLGVIRDTLRLALETGCADLLECTGHPCCPIPFAAVATTEDDQPSP